MLDNFYLCYFKYSIFFNIKDAKEIIIKLDNERKVYDTQIKQFKMMAENMKVELERTYGLLKERKRERDEAVNQVNSNIFLKL